MANIILYLYVLLDIADTVQWHYSRPARNAATGTHLRSFFLTRYECSVKNLGFPSRYRVEKVISTPPGLEP